MITITKSQIKQYLVKYFNNADCVFYSNCHHDGSQEPVVSPSALVDFLLSQNSFSEEVMRLKSEFSSYGEFKFDGYKLEKILKKVIKFYPNYTEIVRELKKRKAEQDKKVQKSINVTRMILKLEELGYKVTKK